MLIYDYTIARQEAEKRKLVWMPELLPEVDKRFAEIGLTQHQVDGCMALYAHYVAWLFTPRTYRWWQRLGLAAHFIFGRP